MESGADELLVVRARDRGRFRAGRVSGAPHFDRLEVQAAADREGAHRPGAGVVAVLDRSGVKANLDRNQLDDSDLAAAAVDIESGAQPPLAGWTVRLGGTGGRRP